MKITILILLAFILPANLFAQDSLWTRKVCSEILALNLPVNAEYASSSYVKGYGGYVKENLYGFQYYDTVFNRIENEKHFQIALTGFINGRISDPSLKNYSVTIIDTSVNGTKGIMAKFKTDNISEAFRQVFYYVTLANSKYYLFYAYAPLMTKDEEINKFFKAITFDSKKIKESSFILASIYLK